MKNNEKNFEKRLTEMQKEIDKLNEECQYCSK